MQDDLIPRSLTNNICKDPLSKYSHILGFQVDMNLGGGDDSPTTPAELTRPWSLPSPSSRGPSQGTLLWGVELAPTAVAVSLHELVKKEREKINSGVNESSEMISADPRNPLL